MRKLELKNDKIFIFYIVNAISIKNALNFNNLSHSKKISGEKRFTRLEGFKG